MKSRSALILLGLVLAALAAIRVSPALALPPEIEVRPAVPASETDSSGVINQVGTLGVNNVLELPVVSSFAVDTDEDLALPFTAQDFVDHYSDPDAEPLVQVKIVTLPANGSLKLGATNVIVGQEVLAASLGTLSFVPNQHWNGATSFQWNASDGSGYALTAALVDITVDPVNDPPTTTGILDVTVQENADPEEIDLYAAFADVEDADADMTYTVTGNTNAALFIGDTPSIDAGTLTLKFKPNTPGTATITVEAEDTGGLAKDTSFKVTVNSVNSAPTVADFSRSTNEDTALLFTALNFTSNYADLDGDPLAKVKIVTLPANGTLKLGAANVIVEQEILAANLGNLNFVPNKDWNGATSFQWNASDGTVYASAAATVTITVNPVNDPPQVFNITKTGPEDSAITFAQSDFASISAFLDIENDALDLVRIVTLPENGTLKLGVTNVNVVPTDIPVASVNTLTFVPNKDWNGTTSFDWNGRDGSSFALTPAKVNITINPANDAPRIDLNGPVGGTGFATVFNVNGSPVVITSPTMTLIDPDGGNLAAAYVKIDNAPDGAAEVLSANKTGTSINVSYSQAQRTLTLQGPDTIENFLAVLKTVTYDNVSTTPDPATRSIRFEVYDGSTFSNTAFATVSIVNPSISLVVEPALQQVVSGSTAVFTISIANIGDVELTNVTLNSTVPNCNKGLVKQELAAGDSIPPIVCSVTNVTQRIDNELVVTAEDSAGGPPVTDTTTAVVRVINPNIYVEIVADPQVGYTVPKGSDVPLMVIVGNPSEARLEDVTLDATLEPIIVGDDGRAKGDVDLPADVTCNFAVIDLDPNQEEEFACTVNDVAAPVAVEVGVVGTVEGSQSIVEDFDRAEINVLDTTIQASADLFEVPVGKPTDVVFSITLTNQGNLPVTLTELISLDALDQPLHGDLLNGANGLIKDSTCAPEGDLPVLAADGGTFACSYTATVVAQMPVFVNRIAFTVEDEEAYELSDREDIEIAVTDEFGVRAILTANPESLIAPGGEIELLVQIRNNQTVTATLEALADSQEGNLDGKGSCAVPQDIPAGESYLCSYKVTRLGLSVGDELTFVLTATVDGAQLTDDVVVRVTERGTRRAMLPAVSNAAVIGEPNDGGCAAMPIMAGLDYYFYPDDQNDWYRVDVQTAGTIEVKLSKYQVNGQLILYDAADCGSIVNDPGKVFSDGSSLPEKRIKLSNRQPGTYFIRVYAADVNETSALPYVLRIDAGLP